MRAVSSESGRSMVEMLGVIAIIGVIAVGGITSMSYVDSYFRTSATLLEIDQVSRDIDDMCSWSSTYTDCLAGYTTDDLVNEDVLSSKTNRWGGNITVAADGDDSYTITYEGVPESACEQMSEELNNTDGTKHFVSLSNTCNSSGTTDMIFVPR